MEEPDPKAKIVLKNLLPEIIPHVFLPRRLPNSEQRNLTSIELTILEVLRLTTCSLNKDVFPNAIPKTVKMLQNWAKLQHQLFQTCELDKENRIDDITLGMGEGDMLALYIKAQNAGFLLSIPNPVEDLPETPNSSPKAVSQPVKPVKTNNIIISSFQASPASETVISSSGPLSSVFPEASVIVPKSTVLQSPEFLCQLGLLTQKQASMAIPKAMKAGHKFNEVRDVADPMLITDWVTAALCTQRSQLSEAFPRIRKKLRDDVIYEDSVLPFRRSGLWLTAKVALQISLIRELGEEMGTAVYKAVVTVMMHYILTSFEGNDWDLKTEMLAKIARRLEKLKSQVVQWPVLLQKYKIYQIGLTDIVELLSTDIVLLRKKMDVQWEMVTSLSSKNHFPIDLTSDELRVDTVHTVLTGLKQYIEDRTAAINSKSKGGSGGSVPPPRSPWRWRSWDFPSFPPDQTGYDGDFELWDFEVWVRSHLDRYCSIQHSEKIWTFITAYTRRAFQQYQNDPVGNSRMIITILKCLQVLDKIATDEYPLLNDHKSGVKLDCLHALVVPLKSDMDLLHELERYFLQRDSLAQFPSLIDEDSPSKNSFSVRFPKQCTIMEDLRARILERAERDIEAKIEEVRAAKKTCQELQKEIYGMTCCKVYNTYWEKYEHSSNCRKCSWERAYEQKRYSVKPFERPLRTEEKYQQAVVFELLIPTPIACLRDALHLFRVEICSFGSFKTEPNQVRRQWKEYDPLRLYNKRPVDVVRLGSSTKPTLDSHYREQLSVDGNDEDAFILNNGLNLKFNSPGPNYEKFKNLPSRCTFHIRKSEAETAYGDLQWAVNGTSHTSNEVMSKQYSCPQNLSLPEFVQFGHLRAGHRLQYRNILMSLTNGKLSLKAEPVFLLLCQAQWQVGPRGPDALRESHRDISETPFATEAFKILTELVTANSENWSDPYTLLNLVVVISRLLELTVDTGLRCEAAELLRECRKIADRWIKTIAGLISQAYDAPEEEKAVLKFKMVDAALCSAMTFHVSPAHTNLVMSGPQDLLFWLNAVSTLYDEIQWNSAGRSPSLSPVKQAILRLSINIGISLEACINRQIAQSQGEGLSLFTSGRWKAADSLGAWKRLDSPREQIYECKAISEDKSDRIVHVDIILGKFLVDGCPLGTLPEEIVRNPTYQRVFEKADFQVQPNKDRLFTTTSEYHECIYNFSLDNNNLLIVNEVWTEKKCSEAGLPPPGKKKLELIPHGVFYDQDKPQLPHNLIEKYSHWWNESDSTIIFRPKFFGNPAFTDSEVYVLDVNTMLLAEWLLDGHNGHYRTLINGQSKSFAKLTSTLQNIEPPEYIHAWLNQGKVEIELVRLGLKFKMTNGSILSHEFPGMAICPEQSVGTLVGLKNKLVLIGTRISEAFSPARKVIVPHAKVNVRQGKVHQSTVINVSKLRTPPFFVYDVDERLRILKAGRNQTAWLFLAELQAKTASPLPDPFTNVTGTERAFQILQEPRCWSYKPYDYQSLKILKAISNLSPKRSYYPENLQCMQRVAWPENLPTSAAHEGFAELALKLYDDSQEFAGLFPWGQNQKGGKSNSENFREELAKDSKEELRLKHYWRQAPLRNGLCLITPEFNDAFESTKPSTKEYKRVSLLEGRISIQNKVGLIADLCQHWRFYLEPKVMGDLTRFLITPANLNGYSPLMQKDVPILGTDVSSWLNFNFRNEWVNLYSFALKVKGNDWWDKWSLLMTLMAFKDVPLEQILILQAVAAHPGIFPEAPRIRSYSTPEELYERSKVLKMLKSAASEFSEYHPGTDSKRFSTQSAARIAENAHIAEVKEQTERLANFVADQWPTRSYNLRGEYAPKINLSKAEEDINMKLSQWYDNYELGLFIAEVEKNLGRIWQSSADKPLIKDLVDVKNPNEEWPVLTPFSIDFDLMMTSQITKSRPQKVAEEVYKIGIFKDVNTVVDSGQDLVKHCEQRFQSLSKKSAEVWNLVCNLMSPPGSDALIASGLYPRLVPTTQLPLILREFSDSPKWEMIQNFIGCIGVLWTMEQRLVRCISYLNAGESMEVALQRELETQGHENWSPKALPGWLILELEMNMMIRDIQLKVALEMLSPQNGQNSVMQLNMGEGKTSLIVPMLAIHLANGKQLCRVTVLKSIFETNVNHLRHTLGGMLNQRIHTIPCRRDLEMTVDTTKTILERYQNCMKQKGIVVTLPEYRLSFQLKGYEMARNNGEKKKADKINDLQDLSEKLIDIQSWLNQNVRDILDESDEILSVKYQLVYTVGEQDGVGGGEMRWIIAQKVLKLLPRRMKDLYDRHGESCVEYNFENTENSETFTACRLLKKECYQDLIDWLAEDLLGELIPRRKDGEMQLLKKFLTQNGISKEDHIAALKVFEGDDAIKLQEIILILAGYLKYGVVQSALEKRWRVNYGVNERGHRKMAVPFKAKDVASERTEFGHPDMAILLTQLSYYYSGLNNDQLSVCFDILKNKHRDPVGAYARWINTIPAQKVHPSVQNYNTINIADYQQRTKLLFPILRKAMVVIDFYLSHVVFPKDSKQFPGKMTCTAWDLTSRNQKLLTTGFSGTNDSSNLYPLTISQNDLPELQNTNKELEDTLLQEENNNYKCLPYNMNSHDLLKDLCKSGIRVLLDCGALMLELNNEQVAKAWLDTDKDIQAVIFFNKKNELTVKQRNGRDVQFELSPFRDRMDVCAVYLDDEHTRGTDLKFPRGSKACVTIGSGLTRDKMVQACMRMRMLGRGHTVSFWASREAHNKIRGFTGSGKICSSRDVLSWVQENSNQFENEGLVFWTASAVNYCQKIGAETIFKAELSDEGIEEKACLVQLGENCSEKEVIKLIKMYGHFRREELFVHIIPTWFAHARTALAMTSNDSEVPVHVEKLFKGVLSKVVARCEICIPQKKNFTQLLDEEQEKELEQELDHEKEEHRPKGATPLKHTFDSKAFISALRFGDLSILKKQQMIMKLPFGFQYSSFWDKVQPDCWGDGLFVTQDFVKTIDPNHVADKEDFYLKPPNWVLSLTCIKKNQRKASRLLLVSPYEANELIPLLRNGNDLKANLHLWQPRMLPDQKVLIDLPNLSLPHSVGVGYDSGLLAPLAVFSGALYFSGEEEQKGVANFLGLIPKRWTTEQDEAFEREEIDQVGFVKEGFRHNVGASVREDGFSRNPGSLVQAILRARNQDFIPENCHVDNLVLRGIENYFKIDENQFKIDENQQNSI